MQSGRTFSCSCASDVEEWRLAARRQGVMCRWGGGEALQPLYLCLLGEGGLVGGRGVFSFLLSATCSASAFLLLWFFPVRASNAASWRASLALSLAASVWLQTRLGYFSGGASLRKNPEAEEEEGRSGRAGERERERGGRRRGGRCLYVQESSKREGGGGREGVRGTDRVEEVKGWVIVVLTGRAKKELRKGGGKAGGGEEARCLTFTTPKHGEL